MKLISLLFLFAFTATQAQPIFIDKGMIEFERTINVHKQLEDEMDNENSSFYDVIKKQLPPQQVNYFNLYFTPTKTLYTPGREADASKKVPEWILGPAAENIVYTDLAAQTFNSQKNVFESVFNIQDSLRKAEWKITPDTRNIAGFQCRKATTIIMDSVFVFAFYTDQIVTRGGPESFTGLPGMILGLAIPRLHATWFATKLITDDAKLQALKPPVKGKKSTVSSLQATLQTSLKQWGKHGQKYIWSIMI